MCPPEQTPLFSSLADDKTVMILLRKPALSYTRDLRKRVDANPRYLETHATDVRKKVSEFLQTGGIYWDQEIFEREWKNVVKEAMIRLKSVER